MECQGYNNFYNELDVNETIEINNRFYVNFCLKYSQLIILVVNELTIEDYYLINLIKSQCSSNQRIIVVHNLIYFDDEIKIENYIKEFFESKENEKKIISENKFQKAGVYYSDSQNNKYYEESYINPVIIIKN